MVLTLILYTMIWPPTHRLNDNDDIYCFNYPQTTMYVIYWSYAAFIASGKYGVSHFQVPSFPVHKWSVLMRIFPPNSATKWRPELLCLFWPYFRENFPSPPGPWTRFCRWTRETPYSQMQWTQHQYKWIALFYVLNDGFDLLIFFTLHYDLY